MKASHFQYALKRHLDKDSVEFMLTMIKMN
ncbi:MAG: hypothetical protein RJA25_2287 [Bacteroidota bacterium]|jgi:hypothetical protein